MTLNYVFSGGSTKVKLFEGGPPKKFTHISLKSLKTHFAQHILFTWLQLTSENCRNIPKISVLSSIGEGGGTHKN